MSETLGPRESGFFISRNAKHVIIHEEKIPNVVRDLYEALKEGNLRNNSITDHSTFPSKHLDQKQALNYVLFVKTLGGCYWQLPGKRPWHVEFRNATYKGTFALYAAVARAYNDGILIFDPTVYSKFTLKELDEILKGKKNVPASLLEERLKCLHEVGTVLLTKFSGSFENCVLQAKGSAQALLKIIIENFPCFDDSCDYLGKRVSFYQRAQMLIEETWGLYYGEGISEFGDMDSITMFADYRVPQALLDYGIFEYSDELKSVLSRNEILERGCEYVAEIRGCSIRAVDLVVAAIREFMKQGGRNYFECNDITVDNYLWAYRKRHGRRITNTKYPFHRVISLCY